MFDPEAALLRAIADAPDDDAVRLVYADYLEEQGGPQAVRGEFIRTQVALECGAGDPPARNRLIKRQEELLAAHFEEWTRELRPFDPEKVELDFARGFPERLTIEGGTDEHLALLRRLPGLRWLRLEGCEITDAALELVAGLRDLDSLTLADTELRRGGLTVLEALPCWTWVVAWDRSFDDDTWLAFQERRIGKIRTLPLEERLNAARRFLNNFQHGPAVRPDQPVKAVRFSQEDICDAEMRLLAWAPELEEVSIFDAPNVTTQGLLHLADLRKLKSLEISKTSASSLHPISDCFSLEKLDFRVGWELPSLGDDGTEGLDDLTNLSQLALYAEGLADRTVERLRPLRRLRELELELGELDNPDCLEALSDLEEMESLYLSVESGLRDSCLRHFVRMKKLRTLHLHLEGGIGDGLEYLRDLTELRHLHLSGPAVTDEVVRHFAGLRKLRTLAAQGSEITEAGARALAARLPEVTIILDGCVVKSPRESTIFRRRSVAGIASALLPTCWSDDGRGSGSCVWVFEDGWENCGHGPLGPAEIRMQVGGGPPISAAEHLRQRFAHTPSVSPQILDENLLSLVGSGDTASRFVDQGRSQHLICAAVAARRVVLLECEAPRGRFEEFRPLFLFVARSLRVGERAEEDVGVEVDVPISALER